MRKDWDQYFMDIAFIVAERSTCLRRHVGALVVKDKRIKGTGYNGSPAGLPHCIDEGCEMLDGHCIRCVHAEPNALLECGPEERREATLYCTDRPCPECQKLIITSGISRVVYGRDYLPHTDWFKLAPWIELVYLEHLV
ncbi:dCMP deaminase [Sporomusaceae bacterium BoRhaA]|uniref:deoxycytidylate deaminase n=1 Tax=Pelorhabdus rhamnosifermentans TaxID=2772457 RepID=UPI001C05FD3F|nr:cytidine/deoxycytidylate deaminase family protein [Pelorhabdus rhamnosifermentans]MBU2702154.1 dCMP deaminase [Pelorhabdus rhamnosifermentans]